MPAQETCVSHSLNLLATNDANKACDANSTFKRTYHAGLAKCTSEWNATHRSNKALDAVSAITDKVIFSPVATHWNSQYDSIKRILDIGEALNYICEALNLPKFKELELECLHKYALVITLLATTLDALQGDNVYYGHVFPYLHILQVKLEAIQNFPLKAC